ncbi:radical SAM protein [Desulfovibrio aminophilus]|nr:radical SAM protein [Desulfovibrio aminophilus]MCM0754932.1 radical SAM protein [Desulfovibrio aminophilus]
MSAHKKTPPSLVFAGPDGSIYDHPDLLMLCSRGDELTLPRPDEFIPLPEESEFFLLPGRRAMGLNPETGQVEVLEETAVAAFVTPAYTLTAHPAFEKDDGAPVLPLFAYGAVGFADGRFWVCAKRVDEDTRQVFRGIPRERIESGARGLLAAMPENRLVRHLTHCALTYGCPAAKNLALGRYEAPLPTARTCNARCVGCISQQPEDSGFPATQCRIAFTPTAGEVSEIMLHHASREKRPILSFGQGCEGEPLTEAALIAESTARYRAKGGPGTVNVNTNASLPKTIPDLARAGVSSIRVSLNSARKGPYEAYYRPHGYAFEDVLESISTARAEGLFVSLNLLFFPGFTDGEAELEALSEMVRSRGVNFIQLRNLNLDPDLYSTLTRPFDQGPAMGFLNFRKRLRKACPDLGFGYFNPYVER